jgi:hypothetical protein
MNQAKVSSRNRRRPHGFTVIEISLALIISAFVGFALIRGTLTESTKSGGVVQADQLLQMKAGLESYMNVNGVALVAGTGVSGVSNALQPTVTELQNLQLLPGQFSTLATLNRSPFVTQISVLPAGCALGSCQVSGYVYIRDPILGKANDPTKGEYDGVAISAMLARLGGDGFARVVSNGALVSSGGAFSIANSSAVAHPSITVNGQPYPAGVVGVRLSSMSPLAAVGALGAGVSGPCPGGTVNNVEATGTGGTGNGNQCFFAYPTIVLGSSATVLNTQTSTVGSMTVRCLAINGNSTLQIASLTCVKK